VKLNTHHVDLFRGFVEKLAKTPDGDGTLLDHTLILYGSGMSESDTHSRLNIPTLLVGKGAGWCRAISTSWLRRKRRWRISSSTWPTSTERTPSRSGSARRGSKSRKCKREDEPCGKSWLLRR
jgi:hypothetical protein